MASKRSTKYFSKPGEDSFLKSENDFLRKKNADLAKALADLKIEHQKSRDENLYAHQRFCATDVQRLRFKEFINTLSLDMQMYIQGFISMTEQMTNMLNKINTVIRSPEALNHLLTSNSLSESVNTPNSRSNKTMAAVMPMISGHTILSPKVNLSRVTVKQLADLTDSHHSDEADSSDEITPDVEFSDNVDVSPNNEYLLEDDIDPANELPSNRLETLQEENEDDAEQTDISSQALLSGVFKDVKVYISPLSNHHVIQFKNRATRKDRSRSFNKSNHSLSARNSLANCSRNLTLTQGNNDSSRSLDSDANGSNTIRAKNERSDRLQELSDDYDPMEGPSNAYNITREVDEPFKPCPNETSTPYLTEIRVDKVSNSRADETATPTKKNVTKRRGNSKETRTLSSKLSNCSVIVKKLSVKTMESYNWDSEASLRRDSIGNVKERNDSPRVSERSRRSSTQLINENRKRSGSEISCFSDESSRPRRAKRNAKPVVYKEPSLSKKMRR